MSKSEESSAESPSVKVKILKTFAMHRRPFFEGNIDQVPESLAQRLIKLNLAEPASDPHNAAESPVA